jgi:hypothetical protein
MNVRSKKSYAEKYGYKLVIKGIEDWGREAVNYGFRP